MMDAQLDVSAQFGGRNAAQAVLPHYRALKEAAKLVAVPRFPARKLAFILRVDGEVNTYGEPGPSNIDVAKDLEYVSVDVVLAVSDREMLGGDYESNPIVSGVLRSAALLVEHLHLPDEGATLRRQLSEFCRLYVEALQR